MFVLVVCYFCWDFAGGGMVRVVVMDRYMIVFNAQSTATVLSGRRGVGWGGGGDSTLIHSFVKALMLELVRCFVFCFVFYSVAPNGLPPPPNVNPGRFSSKEASSYRVALPNPIIKNKSAC